MDALVARVFQSISDNRAAEVPRVLAAVLGDGSRGCVGDGRAPGGGRDDGGEGVEVDRYVGVGAGDGGCDGVDRKCEEGRERG